MVSMKANVPLAPYTYLKIGGPAEWLIVVHTQESLIAAVSEATKAKLSITILGSASNVLIADTGLKGLVIINRSRTIDFDPLNKTLITVSAGTLMNQLVQVALSHHLVGLEDFLGLPGTVGGAIYNNSHYFRHLVGDLIQSVTILTESLTPKTLSQKACNFSYDRSIFQTKPWVILSAIFALQPAGDEANLALKAAQALTHRRQTQPLDLPSSGCMFKNIDAQLAASIGMPIGVTSAGWLIDQAGGKGLKVGGAEVSQVHANFLVNVGGATAHDLVELSHQVQSKVHVRFGVWLEREIIFLGDHPNLNQNTV